MRLLRQEVVVLLMNLSHPIDDVSIDRWTCLYAFNTFYCVVLLIMSLMLCYFVNYEFVVNFSIFIILFIVTFLVWGLG
jgi:hypothetical protein